MNNVEKRNKKKKIGIENAREKRKEKN